MRRSLAWIAIACAVAGCDRCGKHEETTPPAAVVSEPPVPAPDRLLAEATLATPDATWGRVQRGIGGTAGILPSTLGGVACAAAGIDPALAPEIDGSAPAYVVVAGDLDAPSWAIAMRLVDARRARVALIEGEAARFDAKSVAGLDVLAPKGRPPSSGPVAALSRAGFLVVAKSEADVVALAPYATRTMPAHGPAKQQVAIDVPGSALAGGVRSAIERSWSGLEQKLLAQDDAMRSQHGGRAPDFGDPKAIVTAIDARVQVLLAILGDLKGVHVGIDASEGYVRAVATAIPVSADGPAHRASAALTPGDLAPLRALPRDTAVALFGRSDAASRARDQDDAATLLDGVLGSRLAPADAKALRGAMDEWSRARGDWALGAIAWSDTTKGALIDAASSDPDASSRAVKAGLDVIARAPALREPLASSLGVKRIATSSATIPGGGRAGLATLDRDRPPRLAIAWGAGSGEAKIALSDAPLALLAPTPPGATLGDDPALRPLFDHAGDVAGAVVGQPSRAPGCASAPGGVLVAWSRRAVEGGGEAMWGEVDASDAALRCLAPRPF